MTIPKHLMEAKICNKDTCEEIRTLKEENQNNVLNELEKWLKEEIKNIKMNYSQVGGNYFNMSYIIDTYENVLDKLKELKEKYINE